MLLVVEALSISAVSRAVEVPDDYNPFVKKVSGPWARFRPYIPENKEYNLEVGTMWEKNDQYWLGGLLGFHIGRCILSQSETCQQYADFIGGVGGREGITDGTFLSSVRWQFTDLHAKGAQLARIMVGVMNQRDNERDRTIFTYGIGYGWTTSVHKRLDLKIEGRIGYGDRVWGQIFVGFAIKLDRWVDYFAQRLEDMGVAGQFLKGTADITGKVIKGTVETTGKVLKSTVEKTVEAVDSTGSAIKAGGKRATQIFDNDDKAKPEKASPPVIGD